MSRPTLLLVDDSEAVLAFETAALSAHYALRTARNGKEALEALSELRPEAILLDLSMPVMNGEEMLAALQADPVLRDIPVLVVSAERQRGESCLAKGASGFVAKPIRADALLPLVERALAKSRDALRHANLACLPLRVGELELALPLSAVHSVVPRPATKPVPAAPDFIDQMFELWGETVLVLDLAIRFGVVPSATRLEQKLVIVQRGTVKVALCADRVDDPQEFPAAAVLRRAQLGGTEHGELRHALLAVVQTERGQLPVMAPEALLSTSLLSELVETVRGLEQQAIELERRP
jgi:CheY-like chemotaxis protein